MPTNSAVLVPERLSAEYPASSIAFHTYIIRSRCWGSICSASRGDMLKNRGSNSSVLSITPAHLIFALWELAVAGSPKYVCQSQREGGISPMQSLPASRLLHKLCTSGAWGNAPLMPMIAMGSTLTDAFCSEACAIGFKIGDRCIIV